MSYFRENRNNVSGVYDSVVSDHNEATSAKRYVYTFISCAIANCNLRPVVLCAECTQHDVSHLLQAICFLDSHFRDVRPCLLRIYHSLTPQVDAYILPSMRGKFGLPPKLILVCPDTIDDQGIRNHVSIARHV